MSAMVLPFNVAEASTMRCRYSEVLFSRTNFHMSDMRGSFVCRAMAAATPAMISTSPRVSKIRSIGVRGKTWRKGLEPEPHMSGCLNSAHESQANTRSAYSHDPVHHQSE